jgi:hypothetical protein
VVEPTGSAAVEILAVVSFTATVPNVVLPSVNGKSGVHYNHAHLFGQSVRVQSKRIVPETCVTRVFPIFFYYWQLSLQAQS